MKQFFLGITVCFLLNCSPINQRENNTYIPLQADDSLTFFVGLPVEMIFYENYLFVYDFFGEEGLISVVDAPKDSMLFSFLNTGGGPNEVVSLSNLDVFTYDRRNFFGIFDVNTRKYRAYITDSIILNRMNINPILDINVDIPYSINELYKIDQGYVATGFFPDGKFARLDDSLRLIDYVGEYRPQNRNKFSDLHHAQANIGKCRVSRDMKYLASTTFHAGVVEFYSVEADTIIKRWEFIKDDLDYIVKNGTHIRSNNVEGFISVDISDQYVFALYAGEMFDMDTIATYGKYVYQFDLDGELLHIYELDREVLNIYAVGDELKTIVHSPEPMIISYKI